MVLEVRRLSDYRISISLKGERLFYTKTHDYLTIVRKKTIRLLLYDYQLTARYYTIYRTFKRWLSNDFTTILRLFVGRNYDYWLRLFQPERYDYCSPLLAIGRKPEKRCGGKPPVVPRRPPFPFRWTAPPGGGCQADHPALMTRCQTSSCRALEVSRPRRADPV